ncbi:MAG: protoporphyrinogen oxidase [Ornithinibacter sp.]
MSAPAVSTRPHVVVVGGGIAGLGAALEVLDSWPGVRVTLLEGSDRVGGKLRRESVGGHLVDVGAEAMLAVREEGIDLVRRVGAAHLLTTPATTSASVWSRGGLRPLPKATLMGVPTDPASALGVLEPEEVDRLRDEQPWPAGPVTQDVSVGDYIGARLGRAVVDRLVEPLLGGVYAGHATRLSLQATMPALWDRATHGESLVRPVDRAPADRPPFAGIVGGVGQLPDLVASELVRRGVHVRTGSVVRALARSGEGWRLVVGSAAAPEAVDADAVIVCVPSAPAARLLAEHAPQAALRLGEVEVASTAVVTLAVARDHLTGLVGSGFLVPPVEGRTIKASTFSANKWAWTGSLSGEVVHLRASIGRAREEASLQREDADLVAVSVAEISEAIGRPLPTLVDSHVQRWGGGLPQYAVGHVERVAAVRAALDLVPGLEVAGATYDGVGIPATIASALRAARATTAHLAASFGPPESRSTSTTPADLTTTSTPGEHRS